MRGGIMTKHPNSYYEIILIILTLFTGVAYLQDYQAVKVFTTLFILLSFLIKEVVLFLQDKKEEEFKKKLQAITNNELRQDLDRLRDEVNNINLTLFNR